MLRSHAYQSCIDFVRLNAGSIHLAGWLFHPQTPIDRVSIEVAGHPVVREFQLFDRPDVEETFPDCDHARRSGFEVKADFPTSLARRDATVDITPIVGSEQMRVVRAYRCDPEGQPLPPARVMDRAGGATNYLEVGVQALGLVLTNLCAANTRDPFERILDWGCGAGRIARHLTRVASPGSVYGCDIDHEAIKWAQENVHGGQFTPVRPYPPTDYADGFFDAVYGISVMTHLDEDLQHRWLQELRRVTRPGARLLLSVVGKDLLATNMPAELIPEYERSGFAVFVPGYSGWFRKFSHDGYYKEAFHTPEYVERVWGQYFAVEEYIETGYQDLVLLRR